MKIKTNRNILLLGAAAVVVVVIVLLVVLLPSSGPAPGPAPTPTATATGAVQPTATGVGYPTATLTEVVQPTATGVGYPTATSTEVVQPTATSTEVVQPTATGVTYDKNSVYFDQNQYNVPAGGNSFDVYVKWSGTEHGYWGCQLDIMYDASLITFTSVTNGSIGGETPDGCGTGQPDGPGQVRVNTWYSTAVVNNNCCGIMGDGYFAKLTFTTSASNTGTTELGFVPYLEINGGCDPVAGCGNMSIPYTFTGDCTFYNSTVVVE